MGVGRADAGGIGDFDVAGAGLGLELRKGGFIAAVIIELRQDEFARFDGFERLQVRDGREGAGLGEPIGVDEGEVGVFRGVVEVSGGQGNLGTGRQLGQFVLDAVSGGGITDIGGTGKAPGAHADGADGADDGGQEQADELEAQPASSGKNHRTEGEIRSDDDGLKVVGDGDGVGREEEQQAATMARAPSRAGTSIYS